MSRLSTALALVAVFAAPVAQAGGSIDCRMTFDMAGWSIFYKTASGTGTVTCDNGQSRTVSLSAKGGGITVGKSRIVGGIGEFSGVRSIDEVFGSYAAAEAHAGAAKSSKAQAMTKGDVSLALAGKGQGWDLGIAFGRFTIAPR